MSFVLFLVLFGPPVWLYIESNTAYFNFGSDEEAGDADELQRCLEDVSLRGHEAIKVVLG